MYAHWCTAKIGMALQGPVPPIAPAVPVAPALPVVPAVPPPPAAPVAPLVLTRSTRAPRSVTPQLEMVTGFGKSDWKTTCICADLSSTRGVYDPPVSGPVVPDWAVHVNSLSVEFMKTSSVATPAWAHDTKGPFPLPVLSCQLMCAVGGVGQAPPPAPAAPVPVTPPVPATPVITIDPALPPPPPSGPAPLAVQPATTTAAKEKVVRQRTLRIPPSFTRALTVAPQPCPGFRGH